MPITRHIHNSHLSPQPPSYSSTSPTPPPLPPRLPSPTPSPSQQLTNPFNDISRSNSSTSLNPDLNARLQPLRRAIMSGGDAEGYLLLTIPDATISQSFDGEKMDLGKGELAVECVSLPIPPAIGHQTANPFLPSPSDPAPTHDMWLVLRVGDNFEHTLTPGNAIEARSPPGGDGGPTYILREPAVPGAELVLSIAAPCSAPELEDLGTFESLLKQYGVLPTGSGLDGVVSPSIGAAGAGYPNEKAGVLAPSGLPPTYASTEGAGSSAYQNEKPIPGVGTGLAAGAAGAGVAAAGPSGSAYPPESPVVHGGGAEDLHGKLVLMDETTGAVIGELDHTPTMGQAEAADVASQDPTRPVMIDFGPIVANTREVRVTRIPPEDLDGWMLKGANLISKSVLSASGAASGAMLRGAERYRAKAVPRPEPVKMHGVTSTLQSVHGATSAGARVTGKTVGMINNAVERLVSKKQSGGQVYHAPQAGAAGTAGYAPSQPQAQAQVQTGQRSTFGKLKDAALPAATSAFNYGKDQAIKRGYYTPSGGQAAQGTTDYASPAGPPPTGGAPPLPPRMGTPGAAEKAGAGPTASAYTAGAASHSYYPDDKLSAPPLSPGPDSGATTPTGKRKKRPLLNRTLLAADVILSSFEAAANEIVTSGTHAASTAVGARYGNDAGAAVAYTGASVRNAVLVYVDVRGVGRKSILKATAKGYVKAKLKSGETVHLQPVSGAGQQKTFTDDKGHVVVGVPVAPEKH